MRFGIVGAGPIGSILAAHLAQGGQEVYLVDIWREHLEAVLEKGIDVSGCREAHGTVAGTFARIGDLAGVEPDVIVLSVKAPVLRQILPEVAKIVGPRTRLISFQNGLDTEETLAQILDRNRILRVVINYAGSIKAPGEAFMSFFNAPNHIGCICKTGLCDDVVELAKVLSDADLATQAEADIKRHAWEKTILNSALSPVSAVTGFTMKEVMATNDTRRIVEALLEECIRVAAKVGYDFGPGFLGNCLAYLEKGGPHKPSMLVDVEAERETEIDYMNGRIAHYGSICNVPTPLNDTFSRLVKSLERRYQRKEALGVA